MRDIRQQVTRECVLSVRSAIHRLMNDVGSCIRETYAHRGNSVRISNAQSDMFLITMHPITQQLHDDNIN